MIIDLLYKEFGELRVIRQGETSKKGTARWICKCSCGNESQYLSKSLRGGVWDCCKGCRKQKTRDAREREKEKREEEKNRKLDLTGQIFGRLTVLEPLEDFRRFKCICRCGKIKVYNRTTLLYGKLGKCRECKIKKGYFICRICGDRCFKIKLFRRKTCPKCQTDYQKKYKGKYKYEYTPNNYTHPSILNCRDCKKRKERDKFSASQLKYNKYPSCRKCFNPKQREYIKRRCKEDPIFKEKESIGNRIRNSLKKKNFKKTGTAARYLGCSKSEFIKHIESQFVEGMNWDNRSDWHIDHIIPLSRAVTSEDIRMLWHYTNLKPLWAEDNMKKSDF